jgi:hypothetical protein
LLSTHDAAAPFDGPPELAQAAAQPCLDLGLGNDQARASDQLRRLAKVQVNGRAAAEVDGDSAQSSGPLLKIAERTSARQHLHPTGLETKSS